MRFSTSLLITLLPSTLLAFPTNRANDITTREAEHLALKRGNNNDDDDNNGRNSQGNGRGNGNGNNGNGRNNANDPTVIVIGAPAGDVVASPVPVVASPAPVVASPAPVVEAPAAAPVVEAPAAGEGNAEGEEEQLAGEENAEGEEEQLAGEENAEGEEEQLAGEENAEGEEEQLAGEENAEGEEEQLAGELELAGVFGTPVALGGGDIKQDTLFVATSKVGSFEYEFQGTAADELTVVENLTPAAPPAGFAAIEPASFQVSLAASAGAGLTLSKIDYVFDITNPAVLAADITKAQVGRLCAETGTFIIDAALGELEFEADENEVTLNLNKAVTANGEWGIFVPLADAAAGVVAPPAAGANVTAPAVPAAGNATEETVVVAPPAAGNEEAGKAAEKAAKKAAKQLAAEQDN